MDEELATPTKKKKKNEKLKYFIYITIVLVATAISLVVSLWGKTDEVVRSFAGADIRYILAIAGFVVGFYVIDSFILVIFCRLYTRKYHFHQAFAVSMIGQFYSDVTPSATGGQVMQIFTMKKQGVQVSNAASIMVMWFILWQSALIAFDVVAISVEWKSISKLASLTIPLGNHSLTVPTLLLIIIGFIINVSMIFLLLAMSYSHKFHNFILHHVIGFLGKIRLLKRPDKTRENLRVQVENFKIELKRLQANVPIVILQLILFFLLLVCKFCIPYWSGMALHAWDDGTLSWTRFWDSCFLSAFHQMITGMMPLPGSAGVSELFYYYVFRNYFDEGAYLSSTQLQAVVSSTQILWRTSTFHVMLVISGLVAAFYRSSPKDEPVQANRQTYVDVQFQTFEERKQSADTMYETAQLSRKEIQRKISQSTQALRRKKKSGPENDDGDDLNEGLPIQRKNDTKKKPIPKKRPIKKKKQSKDEHWDNYEL